MKQIIAIIREECLASSLSALQRIGVANAVAVPVTGRGRQKGAVNNSDHSPVLGRNAGLHLRRKPLEPSQASHPPALRKPALRFLPKEMLIVMADDGNVLFIVQALISVNRSGRPWRREDFVCVLSGANSGWKRQGNRLLSTFPKKRRLKKSD
jgi:nitrogen regulatory protein PII 2